MSSEGGWYLGKIHREKDFMDIYISQIFHPKVCCAKNNQAGPQFVGHSLAERTKKSSTFLELRGKMQPPISADVLQNVQI
jgi:hypothetical protein